MTIVAGSDGLALFKKEEGAGLTLDRLQGYFSDIDLVISEGYKRDSKPKIAVIPVATDSPPVDMNDNTLFAVFSDADIKTRLPLFRTHEVCRLADMIVARFLSGSDSVSEG